VHYSEEIAILNFTFINGSAFYSILLILSALHSVIRYEQYYPIHFKFYIFTPEFGNFPLAQTRVREKQKSKKILASGLYLSDPGTVLYVIQVR
jgi:hypothetical protein